MGYPREIRVVARERASLPLPTLPPSKKQRRKICRDRAKLILVMRLSFYIPVSKGRFKRVGRGVLSFQTVGGNHDSRAFSSTKNVALAIYF